MAFSQKSLLVGIHSVTLFLLCALIAWVVMSRFDFFYGIWHDHVGIKEGIEQFGPKNRYKSGFAETTRAQRLQIFSRINHAVHHNGQGLRAITYESSNSDGPQRVLREPEVIHLEDVARLISVLKIVSIVIVFTWLAIAYLVHLKKAWTVTLWLQFSGPALLLGCLAIVLVTFGAENVFNTLHIWVFPDDHPWFFYYQDSLMSTMMLAPRLFGWIAGSWALLSLLIFTIVAPLLRVFFTKKNRFALW